MLHHPVNTTTHQAHLTNNTNNKPHDVDGTIANASSSSPSSSSSLTKKANPNTKNAMVMPALPSPSPSPSWYLQVVVGGKSNPMFMSDNLTPAPRSLVLERLMCSEGDADGDNTNSSERSRDTEDDDNNNNPSTADTDVEGSSASASPLSSARGLLRDPSTSASSCNNSRPGSPLMDDHTNILNSVKSPSSANAASSPSSSASSGSFSSSSSPVNSPDKSFSSSNRPRRSLFPLNGIEIVAGIRDDSSHGETNGIDIDPDDNNSMSKAKLGVPISPSYSRSGYGQDAWFVACDPLAFDEMTVMNSAEAESKSSIRHPSLFMGVADGVGGWRSSGVDSGFISRHIMCNSMDILQRHQQNKNNEQLAKLHSDPKDLLDKAYNMVINEKQVDAGSTTACLLAFIPQSHHTCDRSKVIVAAPIDNSQKSSSSNPNDQAPLPSSRRDSHFPLPSIDNDDGGDDSQKNSSSDGVLPVLDSTSSPRDSPSSASVTSSASASSSDDKIYLHSCNLGDSGFCVLRNNRVIFHSSPQRDESHVHQLAVIPNSLRALHADSDYEYADDKPEDALCACCELQENDIVILASDGLWDNLQPKDDIYNLPGFGLVRMRFKPDAPERTSHVHQMVAEATAQAHDPITGHFDSRKCLQLLATKALQLMPLQEGKPDDLTILVAQMKKALLYSPNHSVDNPNPPPIDLKNK